MNRHGNNSNALLVEIMIAVLFFSLCSTVLLDAFIKAHDGSARSAAVTDALIEARNILEQLNAAEEPEALLAANGYAETESEDGSVWQQTGEGEAYRLMVRLESTPTEAGALRTAHVTAWSGASDQPVVRLQSAHYDPAEVE